MIREKETILAETNKSQKVANLAANHVEKENNPANPLDVNKQETDYLRK